MTNLCAEIAIYSLVVTQWTGLTINNKEAGVVVTNHEARVSFEGRTNNVPLRTDLSEVAVWRENQPMRMFLTNNIHLNTTTGFLRSRPYTLEIR